MPKITINNKEIEFKEGMTILQACELAGSEIPRFCYHERLSIAGNCRMCLVELEKSPKPIASCAMPAREGMKIKTNTSFVEKARKGVMEFLLANHPLDCPVCDQGGECDLQDQSLFYGLDISRFTEKKRQVKEKNMGPLIKTQMTRCIHCTRCVRFATEVAGIPELGALGRGEDTEITTYLEKSMQSELSANVIDLCPVGALTSKPYAFEARPWDLKKTETIDVMDAVGSNIRVDTYGWEVKRILPRVNEDINEEWISDKTRYACDGLLKQRLDVPYVRENGKLRKTSWNEALNFITEKLKKLNPSEIAGIVGDLADLETIYSFKSFFEEVLGSKNIECRQDRIYINPEESINYKFNSTINGIEQSDFILLVGTNPRLEATILNARIRKAYIKNKTEIFSLGDPGELTYPYISLGSDISIVKDIVSGTHKIYQKIKESKKPLIILGESALKGKAGEYIFETLKNFLFNNNFITKGWNALNILNQHASRVGALELDFHSVNENDNFSFFNKLDNDTFKFIYLLGADSFNFNKKDKFIVYQGSHGDKGAEIADIILPGSAYTEKDGWFINLEGKLQNAYKASYPPGEAREDWIIFKDLSVMMKKPLKHNSVNDLRKFITQYIEKKKSKNITKFKEINFVPGNISISLIDYYYSNSIARSSKVMNECRQISKNLTFSGIEKAS
ncbi:MAG TPA: NADH-quinone oxidoreductase subunit G [Candidatus Pelagibacter sp.]|jgi:NADH-quinone oxidoreductase subunit G|nr:NADH-quinone oxidoreductase subunit G [Candidatus Pelagibacter sp.]